MQEFLQSIPEDEIVVFVDGYDVIPLRNEKTILKRYYAYNTDILVSIEQRPGMISRWMYNKVFGNCQGQQLNAGMYMGTCKSFKKNVSCDL